MSTYRDEHETLRRQKEVLSEQLAEAQHQLADKDAEIARLRERRAPEGEPAVAPYPLGTGQPESFWRKLGNSFARRTLLFSLVGALVIVLVVAVVVAVSPPPPKPLAPNRVLRGRVASTFGQPHLVAGAPCELTIRALASRFSAFNCHALVRCGTVTLYGEPHGYCTCTADRGQFASASDPFPADGDPALTIDVNAGRAKVFAAGWEVEVQLDGPDAGTSPTAPPAAAPPLSPGPVP